MMFLSGSNGEFKISEPIKILARKALGGAIINVSVSGAPTKQHGLGAIPLFGHLQFFSDNGNLSWPVFNFIGIERMLLDGDSDEALEFEGFVSYNQLEAFEKRRSGKNFSICFNAILNVQSREGHYERWVISNGSVNKTAQEWLNVLQLTGYKNYLFHELAFPADAIVKPNSAYQHLLNAREHFDSGLYKECIIALRGVEEQLRENRKDEDEIKRVTKLFKNDRESMKFSERALFLRNAVNNAMNSAAHIGEPKESFDRPIAKALLIMVTALVELYPEPSN